MPSHRIPLIRPIALFFTSVLALAFSAALPAAELPGLDRPAEPRADLPTVQDLLGYAPGDRHPRNDELVRFYRDLARVSDRMTVQTIGRSSGGREQVLAVFGRPDRLEQLDGLRDGRIQASRDGEGPVIVWLGYSVHGNEASGASAAPIVAWWLAASDDPAVEEWLEHAVVVMEPVINPDGLDRFAHWANMHRGRNPSADPNDREHNEGWPNGRTSYYWFDLNRDWLPLTHPVSQNRIRQYRQWRPHVLTDVHEMGSRSTYFFQPGIPERNNPATPERVFELTARLAEYHAERLDAAGEPYYSRESFDDYYLGKGSTYPDLTGGIGILFEQGSARGHLMDTPYGPRTFADAIANQVRTSLSTLEGSVALRDELREQQQAFFAQARDGSGNNGSQGGWLLGDGGDPARAERLLALLVRHGIDVRPVDGTVSIDGREFSAGSAWAIPARQDLGRFVEAIFDTPTELPMETFYDVSAWPLQHAFDLPLERVRRLPASRETLTESTLPEFSAASPSAEAVAWVVDWRQHRAPAVLAALLTDGYRVQAAESPMTLTTTSGPIDFARGSVVVHAGVQPERSLPVAERLVALAEEHGVEVHAVPTGLAADGLDLGSPSLPVIEAPRVALLTGDGLNPYSAGSLWRWFDVHLDQPLAMLDAADLPGDLGDYTHLLLPGGRYGSFGEEFEQRLIEFVRGGGQLIAVRSAAAWVESLDLGWAFLDKESTEPDAEPDAETGPARYADYRLDAARRLIGGSALAVTLDPTHPLGWGYGTAQAEDADDRRLVLFRQGAHVLKTTENRYARPGRYAESPLVAGYLAEPVADELAGTTAIGADRFGRGLVVRLADDVVFRGYWAGAERLLANAIFHGQQVGSTRLP